MQMLNLWCADGMRGVKLAEVQKVRFLNATMDAEVKKALETLALSHDTQKKAVSLRFSGEGKRRVSVGYVIENPIWKTSYRLVLSPKGEEKPYLQGWAVVENPSDEDWKDVRMVLVSGRPISFQMDLYQPLYVQRPVIVPELFEGLRPVAYSGQHGPSRGTGAIAAKCTMRLRLKADKLAADGSTSLGTQGGPSAVGDGSRRSDGYCRRIEEATRRADEARPERDAVGDGGEAGGLLPVRHRPARLPPAPEVGPAAHRRQGRAGQPPVDLQRARAGQVPAAGPALQEHLGPAPHAGAGHRLRGLHVRRRRPRHGPAAQRGAPRQLRHGPRHRGQPRARRPTTAASSGSRRSRAWCRRRSRTARSRPTPSRTATTPSAWSWSSTR